MSVIHHLFAQSAIEIVVAKLNAGLRVGVEECEVALALRAGTLAVLDSDQARELVPLMFREVDPSVIVTAAIESGGSVASAVRLYCSAVAVGCAAQEGWGKVPTWVNVERPAVVS